jgi:hypothetical protein
VQLKPQGGFNVLRCACHEVAQAFVQGFVHLLTRTSAGKICFPLNLARCIDLLEQVLPICVEYLNMKRNLHLWCYGKP